MPARARPTIRKKRPLTGAPCYGPAMVDEPAAPKKRGRPRKPEAEKAPRESKRMGRPPKEGVTMARQIKVSFTQAQLEAVEAEFNERMRAWREGNPVPSVAEVIRGAIDFWIAGK